MFIESAMRTAKDRLNSIKDVTPQSQARNDRVLELDKQIQDLETEIGGPLLDRSGRRTRLTQQGQIFLEEARKILEAADRAIDLTRRSLRSEVGTLTVGFFLWGSGGFFPRIIRELRRTRPGIPGPGN